MGAMLSCSCSCSFGAAPSSLVLLPTNCVLAYGPPAATIMDHLPMFNIMPFGMCNSPATPMVIAAAAALGVLTPMPGIPVTAAPWMPGAPTVLITDFPALDDNCSACATGAACSPSTVRPPPR
jgi:hypothetical protein